MKDNNLAQVEKEVRQRLGKYLEGAPYRFNPDASVVDTIIKGLALRKLKTGHEYCPCRVVTGKKEEDEKIVCPCAYHEEEIRENEICYCGLFVGPDYKAEEIT